MIFDFKILEILKIWFKKSVSSKLRTSEKWISNPNLISTPNLTPLASSSGFRNLNLKTLEMSLFLEFLKDSLKGRNLLNTRFLELEILALELQLWTTIPVACKYEYQKNLF